ncbi:IS110 family transposase [Halanaerobium congolense]|uniref:Transposase n=1 Tax=Halanaerobium congolense TaxID=54121 RepID=A0A4R7DS01_9FIRM|nr:transposase [Halanaerobium congolense]TDS24883.1 transposase [Halanaerobium congolense]
MDNQTLFVGCDVSSDDNYYCFLLNDGTELTRTHLSNNADGADNLINIILNYLKEYSLKELVFGVEATSNYHFHLLNFIALDERLSNYKLRLYQLNATLVRNFKKAYPVTVQPPKYGEYVC